ncbi:MAG: hypothetical protein M3275_02005 [Thermoproteota archaeon]|nr:hypothetical protein [Thermoproteota archaeon]
MKPAASTTTTQKQTILSDKGASDYTTCILLWHDYYKLNIHCCNSQPCSDGKYYDNISAQNPILLTEFEEPFCIGWHTVPFCQLRHEIRQPEVINSSITGRHGLTLNPEFAEVALRRVQKGRRRDLTFGKKNS